MLNSVFWFAINLVQVFFFFVWSALLQTLAILARLVTFGVKLPLWMAHKLWAPALIGITGSPIETKGLEKVDFSKPHIFAFTHQSTLDIAVAFTVLPIPLQFVAKKELLYIPFLGWYMWATGMIFVERRNRERAIASLKRAAEQIREGSNIVAFPEGTRSPDGKVWPLKKGTFVLAIEAGVPVVPIAIEGTRFVMPKDSFRIRKHPIRVSIGEPIPTADLEYEDRAALMEAVHSELVRLNIELDGLGATDQVPAPSTTPNTTEYASS